MSDSGIKIKSKEDLEKMKEGGKKLAKIKKALMDMVAEGVSAKEVDDLADEMIKKEGGKASFKMVPNYSWATCVNVNEGVVHGIPKKELVFKKRDVVSVDVGIFYEGFHTDTSFSLGISSDEKMKEFLKNGKKALDEAIKKAKPGNRVFDISNAMEKALKRESLTPIRALVGHGVGEDLHEEPQIPCFIKESRENTPELPEGAVLAIEVMYKKGSPALELDEDGWTIKAQDDKIAALFEETVAVTGNGPLVLTKT